MRKGFTALELLLVVALISVITLVATAFASRFVAARGAGVAADQIMASLRKAQMYTIMGKGGAQWGVRYGSSTVTLFQGPSYASRTVALDEKYAIPPSVSVTGFSEIVFSRLSGASATATISVVGANTASTITVNAAGVSSE